MLHSYMCTFPGVVITVTFTGIKKHDAGTIMFSDIVQAKELLKTNKNKNKTKKTKNKNLRCLLNVNLFYLSHESHLSAFISQLSDVVSAEFLSNLSNLPRWTLPSSVLRCLRYLLLYVLLRSIKQERRKFQISPSVTHFSGLLLFEQPRRELQVQSSRREYKSPMVLK